MPSVTEEASWKGPTIRAISDLAGVGPATVDRVMNNRTGVREKTRQKVLAAYEKLAQESRADEAPLRIQVFCESGQSFNGAVAAAATWANRSIPSVKIADRYVTTSEMDAPVFGRGIEAAATTADGVIIVSREHPAVNRAVRKLVASGVPVVCLTTDLPSSRRSAYVGNDQYAAGSVAAELVGNACPRNGGRILLVMSVAFRSQQEREMGFRRVLRADFPHLAIEERVVSDDGPETTAEILSRHFAENGVPDAIYNLAGGNRGVAEAIKRIGQTGKVVFVGHELTPAARDLLEAGSMTYVISHDFEGEIAQAVKAIRDIRAGRSVETRYSQILVHTRHNCGL